MKKYCIAVLGILDKSGGHEDPVEVFTKCSVPESEWQTLLAFLQGKVYPVYAGGRELPISIIIKESGRRYLHQYTH